MLQSPVVDRLPVSKGDLMRTDGETVELDQMHRARGALLLTGLAHLESASR